MATRVVNKYKDNNWDIDITRNGPFGNPFILDRPRARASVIRMFRDWLLGTDYIHLYQDRRRYILDNLHELKDKKLGCVCHPEPCHGDIYIDIITGVEVPVR